MTITKDSLQLQINEHGRNKPIVVAGPLGVGKMTHTLDALPEKPGTIVRLQANQYCMTDFAIMSAIGKTLYPVPDAFHSVLKENIGEQPALVMIDGLQYCESDVAVELMKMIETGKINGHELGKNLITVIDAGSEADLEHKVFRNCQKIVFRPFDEHLQSAKFLVQFASYDTRHDVVIGGLAAVDPHFERITNLVEALNGLEGGAFGAEAIVRGIPPELTETLLKIKAAKSANPSPDERLDELCAAIDQCTRMPELSEAVKAKFEHHGQKPEDDLSR
jgi:hypothetical protein